MPYAHCQTCRRYYRAGSAHDCPSSPPSAKPEKENPYYRRRPWMVTTQADRVIAKRFSKTVTSELFK